MPSARGAQLALRLLDRCLVPAEYGARQVPPGPARLVWLWGVLWRYPLLRDITAVFLYVEQLCFFPVFLRGK